MEDIHGNTPKAGDRIRIFSSYYTVVVEDDGNLWANPDNEKEDNSKMLNNWNGWFEIINSNPWHP